MNRMKQLREERHMSMREVANHLGIPYTTYVNYEKGEREPSFETLISIANFFNTSTDYLIGKSSNRVDEGTLDRVIGVETFLLSLTGNLYDAEIMQKMIDDGCPDDAVQYFKEKAETIKEGELEKILTAGDSDFRRKMISLLVQMPSDWWGVLEEKARKMLAMPSSGPVDAPVPQMVTTKPWNEMTREEKIAEFTRQLDEEEATNGEKSQPGGMATG